MRDFKFRAFHHGRMYHFLEITQYIGEPANVNLVSPNHGYHGAFAVGGEAVLMQSTGIVDRNGVEIYEGDILQFDVNDWGGPEDSRFVVEWDAKRACFDGNGSVPDWSEWCTVIGNVWESPGLAAPTPEEMP